MNTKESLQNWLMDEMEEIYITNIKDNKEFKESEEKMEKAQNKLCLKIKEYINDIDKQEEVLGLIDNFDSASNCSMYIAKEIIYKEAFIRGISLR